LFRQFDAANNGKSNRRTQDDLISEDLFVCRRAHFHNRELRPRADERRTAPRFSARPDADSADPEFPRHDSILDLARIAPEHVPQIFGRREKQDIFFEAAQGNPKGLESLGFQKRSPARMELKIAASDCARFEESLAKSIASAEQRLRRREKVSNRSGPAQFRITMRSRSAARREN